MNQQIRTMSLLVVSALGLMPFAVNAYPVDPAKVPVNIAQSPDAAHDFTLAYDSADPKVIYYAPKAGRVAVMNNMPILGFAKVPNGDAYLNAQLEFGVFGWEKDQLFKAISGAGYTPVPFPYINTSVIPLVNGIDQATGKRQCADVSDPTTGTTTHTCAGSMFEEVLVADKGPSLGEFIPVSAHLNPLGAAVYGTLLTSGDALQLELDARYYVAGTAFSAKVTVDWEKLYNNFQAHASYGVGWFGSADLKTAWKEEGLCLNKSADQCAIQIEFTDERGNHINNVTIDPNDADTQGKVLQAIDRLTDQVQKDMFTPIATQLGPLNKSSNFIGWTLNAQFEHQKIGQHAVFEFKSPQGVNYGTTAIPVTIACVKVDDSGRVNRLTDGDCGGYWGVWPTIN